MVRYPESERRSLANIEDMRIRLPDGTEIPFRTIADRKDGRGYANIKRVDRRRVVNVSADVDENAASTTEINRELYSQVLPRLKRQYPGLQYRPAGERRERNESLGSLRINFAIALLAIYGLLAVQFRSYAQPAIVMSAIPFGIVGATIGHLLLGFNLSILSLFGIVALSGVVVNDSLIMIDLINRERKSGIPISQVIRDCATRRFRPIMLTTLTTFLGLAPMMLERSLQARFLIPMAVSLAFGVMFATLITLFLVPSLYMILEDIKTRIFGQPAS
jgi:multidrug efflux pump subunit AcrB